MLSLYDNDLRVLATKVINKYRDLLSIFLINLSTSLSILLLSIAIFFFITSYNILHYSTIQSSFREALYISYVMISLRLFITTRNS